MLWNIIQKFQEDFESSDENKVQQLGRYAYEYIYIYMYNLSFWYHFQIFFEITLVNRTT